MLVIKGDDAGAYSPYFRMGHLAADADAADDDDDDDEASSSCWKYSSTSSGTSRRMVRWSSQVSVS